jgi:hypothetical protein
MGCWNATLTMWRPAVASRRRDWAPSDDRYRSAGETDVQAVTEQGPAQRPVIDVLYVEGCPNYRGALALVERVRAELGIDAELRITRISDQAAADQARFPGSPTVRVDGHDVEPGSEPPAEFTLACRLYRLEHRFAGQPDERWVREALLRAAGRG